MSQYDGFMTRVRRPELVAMRNCVRAVAEHMKLIGRCYAHYPEPFQFCDLCRANQKLNESLSDLTKAQLEASRVIP